MKVVVEKIIVWKNFKKSDLPIFLCFYFCFVLNEIHLEKSMLNKRIANIKLASKQNLWSENDVYKTGADLSLSEKIVYIKKLWLDKRLKSFPFLGPRKQHRHPHTNRNTQQKTHKQKSLHTNRKTFAFFKNELYKTAKKNNAMRNKNMLGKKYFKKV